jgi:hypothetical protein
VIAAAITGYFFIFEKAGKPPFLKQIQFYFASGSANLCEACYPAKKTVPGNKKISPKADTRTE